MDSPSREEVKAQIQAIDAWVEARLSAIESSLAVSRAEFSAEMSSMRSALIAEIHRSSSEIIKWVAGIVVSAMALGLTVMTFVLNTASPRPSLTPSPVIITLPFTSPTHD